MYLKRIILICIIILFISLTWLFLAEAQTLSLGLSKSVYYPNETVTVEVNVKNNNFKDVSWQVECAFMPKDSSIPPMLFLEPVELGPYESKELVFSFTVHELMPAGEYQAKIRILENEKEIKTISKTFEIQGTKKTFDLSLRICADQACQKIKKVFIKEEKIYLSYSSDVSDLGIVSKLVYPDNKEQEISLATDIAADHVGNYTFKVTAEKSGYQSIEREIQFAVIDKPAQIKSASMCTVDGICSGQENIQNCPQDCGLSERQR